MQHHLPTLDGELCGIAYTTDLAGPGGVHLTLLPHEGHSPQAIADAIEAGYRKHDVVSHSVTIVKRELYAASEPEAPAATTNWEPAARWVRDNYQARRVHPESGELIPENKRGGVLLDAFTASALIGVYDAISDVNQARFRSMPLAKAAEVAFKMLA